MDTEEILEQIVNTTKFATDIIDKLPNKRDTAVKKLVKCVAIADSVRQKYFVENNGLTKAIKKLKAKKVNSRILKDIFFQTDMQHGFDITTEKVNNSANIINAKSGNAQLSFVERTWSTTPYITDEFYVKNMDSLDMVIESLWDKHNGSIHVSYETDPIEKKKNIKLSTIEINDDPLLGKSDNKLNELIEKQKKFSDLGISRTYCLIGKPGTGKSTFAFRFGRQITDRVLRFDAQQLGYVINSIGPFIISLKPKVIIFDDFDRIISLETYMPTVLTLIIEIKRRFPDVIIILTANDEKKLGGALLRPGRIDEIIDFEPPNKEDIKTLLINYMDSIGAKYTDYDVETLTNLSDGLAHSYIKELALRKKVLSVEDISKSIARMKQISSIKAAPKVEKAEDTAEDTAEAA